MTIDRQALKAIQADVLAALSTVATKHGVAFKADKMTYDSSGSFATIKLTVSVGGADETPCASRTTLGWWASRRQTSAGP
jgi:hypothetical protein